MAALYFFGNSPIFATVYFVLCWFCLPETVNEPREEKEYEETRTALKENSEETKRYGLDPLKPTCPS